MKKRRIGYYAKHGLAYSNPLLTQLLGLCTAVFACKTVKTALAMGICTTVVLVLSAVTVSALRRVIPKGARRGVSIAVICGYVTALQLILKAFLPWVDNALGVFVPLIAVSGFVFIYTAELAARLGLGTAVCASLFSGIGYTLATVVVAAVIELFGSGSFLGTKVMGGGAHMLTTPAGAFICLGLLAAAVRFISRKRRDEDDA